MQVEKELYEAEIEKTASEIIPKIGTTELKEDDFNWYSHFYCWGCGKRHTNEVKTYRIHREKEISWRSGPWRKYKTLKKDVPLPLCPDCYNKIRHSEEVLREISEWRKRANIILCSIITITCIALYLVSVEALSFVDIAGAVFFGFIFLGGLLSLGQVVIYPFICLISIPFFRKKKTGLFKPIYKLNHIPQIRDL